MSFADLLRQARASRTAVLHEFWTQYDPAQSRTHAFFEGHEDVVFYGAFLRAYCRNSRLFAYRCEGKQRVYDVYHDIMQKVPNCRGVLFFVDKDLDDILGTPWPTDPRIFVTDVYSIENYLVSKDSVERIYVDLVRARSIRFDLDQLLQRFVEQLDRFQRLAITVMAWVIVVRRAGQRPNLNNINAGELFLFSGDGAIRTKRKGRIKYLTRVTGVSPLPGLSKRILRTCREIRGIPAKRIVRGKFEAWFFVEYWKQLVRGLQTVAREEGQRVQIKIALEHSNFVNVLAGRVRIPPPLGLFLGQHFQVDTVADVRKDGVLRKLQSVAERVGYFMKSLLRF